MNVRERVGQDLLALRKERGLTLRGLSQLCGIPFQKLNLIELGRYSPGIDVLSRVTDALEADIFIIKREEQDV